MVTRALILATLITPMGCGTKTQTSVVPLPSNQQGKPDLGGDTRQPPEGNGGGRNAILQMPFDQASKLVMMNIGQAYLQACISKAPKNYDDLGQPQLWTKRDLVKKDVEVLYGVDVTKLGEDKDTKMLAWEKEPDANGGRMVLMADCKTVKYLNENEFKTTPKAK